MLPLLMPDLWRLRRTLSPEEPAKPLQRPAFVMLALGVLALMVALFLIGEVLPNSIVPPEVAIIAAALALLVIYQTRFEPIEDALRDVDWKTLLFLGCIFCLVQGVTKTGLLQAFSVRLYELAGTRFTLVALGLLVGIGLLSGLLANTPVVAASILMIKGYLVAAEVVPEAALADSFSGWPVATIPIFVAMMFGATLGGNMTLIGASANIVAAGVSARNGRPITFVGWLRYGVPLTVCQLAVSALYVLVLVHLMR